jgi:peptidoglycan/LPS O-acetylase OafA/YrhL
VSNSRSGGTGENKVQREITQELSPELRANSQIPAKSRKGERITALDFTKGALVLIMVLYHWVNYFIGPQWEYYRYLRFLTPSFIFITGFMISNVYLSKYDATDPRLPKRLFVRGLKLLALFVVLNMARILLVPVLSGGSAAASQSGLTNLFAIFITGNVSVLPGKVVSFSILVPISYLLILSGALILPYRVFRPTFQVVGVSCLLTALTLDFLGLPSWNLEALTIGLLGVAAGFIPIARINKFVQHPYLLGAAYLCYIAAITVWNVPFSLLIVGVCLSVMAIYLAGSSDGKPGRIRAEFILLGKYSLFGYISQIAILQFLRAGFRHVDLGPSGLGLTFCAAFFLTILSVEVVDRARAKATSMDRLYKAVFA